ncbi:MAG TPA: hypothetical protein VEL51_16260 [Vicinamibacterales bacterium]|nr:hypothetical protein [Vicinamibacterales bacterium]
MASSKDVLTVVGMLCVNRQFRKEFFNNPTGQAETLVGKLREDEATQILQLAGKVALPGSMTRTQFVENLQNACNAVSLALGGCDTCPSPPCPPCPDTREY